MRVESTRLPGVLLIVPDVWRDERGQFSETWEQVRYTAAGLPVAWAQDNVSHSRRGVLRGLHFQSPNGQGKLVSALAGEIVDVAVDVRRGSPTFGTGISVVLSAETAAQLWIPPGFAHGFQVVSDSATVHYKCTSRWSPEAEHVLVWNDPSLDLDWPDRRPTVSARDAAGVRLQDFPADALPEFAGP